MDYGGVDYIRIPFNVSIVQARGRTHLELKAHRDILAELLDKKTLELEESQGEYMTLFMRQAEAKKK